MVSFFQEMIIQSVFLKHNKVFLWRKKRNKEGNMPWRWKKTFLPFDIKNKGGGVYVIIEVGDDLIKAIYNRFELLFFHERGNIKSDFLFQNTVKEISGKRWFIA